MVELGIHIYLILHKASEMRTEDTGFVRWIAWPVVAYSWVLSKRYAHRGNLQIDSVSWAAVSKHSRPYLFRQRLHMITD